MNPPVFWLRLWLGEWGMTEASQWLLATMTLALTMIFVIVPGGAVLYYLDRKLTADFQARVGPNQAGPSGLLQPIADVVKLLQKESRGDWRLGENLWIVIHSMALYSTLAVMPLGSMAVLVDTEMSAFFPFWSALVLALGTMLLGLNQNTVPGWFGGIRVAAQTLAGAFPALIALLCVGVSTGSFKWSIIAGTQGFAPWSWTFVSNPFLALAFAVFMMSGLMLMANGPLDGGLSMTDIYGGVASSLYGRRLGFYRFSRFYVFLLWSVITVVLFLGGWNLPFAVVRWLKDHELVRVLGIFELVWLLFKTFFMMLLVVWVARSSPKIRVDQITDFSWTVLSPFSLVALMGTSLWVIWNRL